jgi:hypothetical protein
VSAPLRGEEHVEPRARAVYTFVLDEDDRVTYVSAQPEIGIPFLGQIVWERLPESERLLRDRFDEARRTGEEVEFTVFYGGGAKRIQAKPAHGALSVRVEPLTALDVSSLATLAESLRKIEVELAARASEPRDPPAPSSLRALP